METLQTACAHCQKNFELDAQDQAFYKEINVPHPTQCPDCREQRRLAWRNERTLYLRKCDLTGEPTLSVFSEDKPYKVYKNDHWYSDKWNPLDYGQDFDFSRPFFEQFDELLHKVPQLALSTTGNQNSDFINQAGWCKDCYLIFEADFNEKCMYSTHIGDSRDCMDGLQVMKSELCYECIDCQNGYNLRFAQDSMNCSDSWFLKNCIGCSNCFGCVNLRNQKFCIYNEQYSQEDYFKKLASFDLQNRTGLEKMRDDFTAYAAQFPHKNYHGVQTENCKGDYLYNSQNCHGCFDVSNSQDCKFVTDSRNCKKVYDMTVFGAQKGVEFCYECHEVGHGVRNLYFCDQVWDSCYELYYTKLSMQNCHHLFGCIGFRRGSYCILNKQYTKEEYEALVPRIIEHMKKTGEWGEFFPISMSPFAYNETLAEQYFPLGKEKAEALGYGWKEEAKTPIVPGLPACDTCGKNYKIVSQEEEFYQKMKLPHPTSCSECRHKKRSALRNPRKLWDRACAQCSTAIQTSYSPERSEKVLCEACYLKETY
ncbi:MAG: zinc-ribbon domain containing protein [Patescibacteria group bacterium]